MNATANMQSNRPPPTRQAARAIGSVGRLGRGGFPALLGGSSNVCAATSRRPLELEVLPRSSLCDPGGLYHAPVSAVATRNGPPRGCSGPSPARVSSMSDLCRCRASAARFSLGRLSQPFGCLCLRVCSAWPYRFAATRIPARARGRRAARHGNASRRRRSASGITLRLTRKDRFCLRARDTGWNSRWSDMPAGSTRGANSGSFAHGIALAPDADRREDRGRTACSRLNSPGSRRRDC